jgi:glucosylceramidase
MPDIDMKKISLYAIIGLFAFCSCACESKIDPVPEPQPEPEPQPAEVFDATLWTTTFDKSRDFEKSGVAFGKAATMSPNVVRFTDETFQTVDGFGLAVTQASCYNLLKMSASDRTKLLTELFSPTEGAGSSLIRVCIGGSDFSMDEYTWCDKEGMANFAVHESEVKYLFPVLDEIYKINPSVQIIGSPWSCPRWMKMDVQGNGNAFNSWTSGRLNPKYYADYADYFVKWVQEMEKRGYKVMGVTLQNEPLNHGNSMSLYMPWEDQRDFLKVVGPAFEKAGLSTQILLFDHNYNYDNAAGQKDYPLNIYADATASKYAAGSAWHNYGGSVSELDKIHQSAPEKGIWFTEASIGTWNYGKGFGPQFQEDFREIVLGTLKRYGKGVTLWNLMLDDEGKPFRPGGCSTCYGAVSIDHASYTLASVDRKSHWYDVVHASVAVKPGAVRIGTKGHTAAGVTYLAFRNPDKSYGVLFLNEGSAEQQFVFATDAHSVSIKVPAQAVVSATWKD